MEEQAALLKTIIDNPDDDTARLVYADWLEENAKEDESCFMCHHGQIDSGGTTPWGEPIDMECPHCSGTARLSNGYRDHAEFIRVQCELARLGLEYSWGDGSDLRRRQVELWNFVLHLPPGFGWTFQEGNREVQNIPHVVVRRGFVESISLTFQQALDHPEIFRENPIQPTATMVTDREPMEGYGVWIWYNEKRYGGPDPDPEDRSNLPEDFFILLKSSVFFMDYYKSYPTRDAAMLALSRAVIAKARI